MKSVYAMRALVADNQYFYRELLKGILEDAGHDVDCAEHGLEAVVMYKQAIDAGRPYEFICLENKMSVMEGFEAMELIREYEQVALAGRLRATVCFVSADEELKNRYLRSFCPDYHTRFVDKPLNLLLFKKLIKVISYERASWKKYA